MSIIQSIRDKYARWAVVAIALALLGFLLMDAFAGRTGLFNSGPGTTVGKINGKKIERADFDDKAKKMEDYYSQRGQQIDDNTRQQLMAQTWEQEIAVAVMQEEYDKLGLTVTQKELDDILYGANPPADLKQSYTDEKTGIYNAAAARQEINSALKNVARKQQVEDYFEGLRSQRLQKKFMDLITGSIYVPKWFVEKRNTDNSLMARISYVSVDYASVPDSSVKVSDDEIKNYMKDHKDLFEQKNETRTINYVLFSASPSKTDSAAAFSSLIALKPELDSTKTDYAAFVQSKNSQFQFFDGYMTKNDMQQANKDSILTAPVGVSYGPYLDVNNNSREAKGLYVISKIIDTKQRPDTVKVRHILIGTSAPNPQTGQPMPIRDDSSAKRLADSVFNLVKQGQNFDTLVVKFSDDPGSKTKGGVYDSITANRMVPTFNDYIFDHKTGERAIVKTDFGYHIIEILAQRGSSTAYKIAYLTSEILTSNETEQEAINQANAFAGDSRDTKSFDANFESKFKSKGYLKSTATISELDYNLQGVQANARTFVRKVFDTDRGDVINPDRVGNNYIVAVVTDITEPGLQSVSLVRPGVEPLLRNKKKADIISNNIGPITTLEQVSAKVGKPIQTVDSLRITGGTSLGFEQKVLGASFNPANKGKVVTTAIPGQQGVYVIRVENQTTTPVDVANVEEQRKMEEMQARQSLVGQLQQYNPIIETLKRAADVKDYRAKFY